MGKNNEVLDSRMSKIRYFFKDNDKKPFFKVVHEMTRCWANEGEFPMHYITRFLYKKGVDNYLDYMGDKKIGKIQTNPILHDRNLVQTLQNKVFFNYYFENTDIRLPRMLAYNYKNNFYIDKECFRIDSYEKFIEFIEKLINNSESSSVFVKLIGGIGGKKSFKFDKKHLDEGLITRDAFEKITSSDYIFQESIIQHPDVSKLYPNSINTIRMDTYLHDNGEVEIISALMRFGIKGSYVDNGSSGGCFVSVDLEKGTLRKIGRTYLESGSEIYFKHPDTGTVFENYKLPYIEEAKELVKNAVKYLPDKLIGWDVGITKDGPIIVEGNHNYHIAMSEMAYGGYKNHPVYQEILKKYI